MATATPLYTPIGPVKDSQLTQACPAPAGVPCGDFAVNTIQPAYQPYSPGTAESKRLPPQRGVVGVAKVDEALRAALAEQG